MSRHQVLDKCGYRYNVGVVLTNTAGQVFWGKRVNQEGWQFPQGGVDEGESAEEAVFREMYEEIGVEQSQVTVIAETKSWLRYKLPRKYIRESEPNFMGQKQKWFLMKLNAEDSAIRFDKGDKPEFDAWQWVTYWYPLRQVISFKREVYRRALRELAPYLFALPIRGGRVRPLNYLLEG